MGLELMVAKKAILIESINLANLFSETTGATIEHFIITHKIERAKELLIYERNCIQASLFQRSSHLGKPDDIAWGIVYLASDESKFVTGSELIIDGGYTAK